MSYPWMLVRGSSTNPSSLKWAALMNKQSIAENELFKPERQQPSIISAHTEDWILLQDPFFFTKLRTKTHKYYAPWEPDGVYLKYWCRFNHIARKLKDHSFSNNLTYPHGKPRLCEGPDDGVKGGRIVTRINSDPNSIDYFSTPHNSNISVSGASNGFSLYLEFIAESTESAEGSLDATLQYKFDDSNNMRGIRIRPDGAITFLVEKAGVTADFATPANAIIPNTLYKCWFRYHPTGPTQSVIINNVHQTDTGNLGITESNGTTDLIHGKRGSSNSGRFVGRLIDSRMYNFVVDNDHMTNMWNNGRSICARNVARFVSASNNDIGLGNDATLWSKPLTKYAFSFWIYPILGNDGINRLIARHGNTGYGFEVDIDSSVAGQIYFQQRNSDNTVTHEANNGSTLARLLFNKWNLIIVSYDNSLGSANGRIYVNGELGSQTFNFTDTINSSNNFELGGPSNDFDGDMVDFRWWSNDAFNTTEAEEFWNTGVMPSTPDYWLKMNEGNGLPVDWITRTKTAAFMDPAWQIGSSPRPTEFGSLAIAGYTRFNDIIDAGGFDTTGFDDTGFDTT